MSPERTPEVTPAHVEVQSGYMSGMVTMTRQATLGVTKKLADHPAISHLKTTHPTAATRMCLANDRV